MAFEMICGQCRGNLLVEHFGVVVACPHCGAHLHIPDPAATEPPAPQPQPQPVSSPTEEMPAFEFVPPPTVEISVAPSITVSDEPIAPVPSTSALDEPLSSAAGAGAFSLSKVLTAPVTDEPITPEPAVTEAVAPIETPLPINPVVPQLTPESATSVTEPQDALTDDEVRPGLSDIFGTSAPAPPSHEASTIVEPPTSAAVASRIPGEMTESDPPFAEPSQSNSPTDAARSATAATGSVKPPRNDQVTVSKAMFAVLISYASAATLGFAWLLYQMKTGGGGGLEALPDPVPAKKTGFQWYPPRTVMTAGHNLGIGDSQRYGNIKVTVLKVTRGPIRFRHFSNPQQKRRPTFPVLKLWLRFENVSDDQEIAPLDDQLLFRRSGNNYTEYRSSQFVCRADQKSKAKPQIVIAYDHVVGSGWDLENLPLEKPLAPHESREYYVPTCEQQLDELTGDLIWRVHIRKGYSVRGNGVTTLFEVHFDSDDIHDEQA